jgi:organic radical activating enzyme
MDTRSIMLNLALETEATPTRWASCRFLTCSVLPVRTACNLTCPFCFSKSSVSALQHERAGWNSLDVESYYAFAQERGATRLVITGGGEPLLKPDDVVSLIERGRGYFSEVACFTNGTFLTREWSKRLRDAGLSYLCYSRHHHNDDACRQLMGPTAPTLDDFFDAADGLKIRATCVMTRGAIDSREAADEYRDCLARYGVREFTFKHTYIAYEQSFFRDSSQNQWAREHQVQFDPFENQGLVLARLPWGPTIRRLGEHQVCFYYEPQPQWEQEHLLCRSINLLSDGSVYASLEDQRSRLFQLRSW